MVAVDSCWAECYVRGEEENQGLQMGLTPMEVVSVHAYDVFFELVDSPRPRHFHLHAVLVTIGLEVGRLDRGQPQESCPTFEELPSAQLMLIDLLYSTIRGME